MTRMNKVSLGTLVAVIGATGWGPATAQAGTSVEVHYSSGPRPVYVEYARAPEVTTVERVSYVDGPRYVTHKTTYVRPSVTRTVAYDYPSVYTAPAVTVGYRSGAYCRPYRYYKTPYYRTRYYGYARPYYHHGYSRPYYKYHRYHHRPHYYRSYGHKYYGGRHYRSHRGYHPRHYRGHGHFGYSRGYRGHRGLNIGLGIGGFGAGFSYYGR